MIFNHKVKVNGVYYDTGADVPVSDEPVKTEVAEVKTEATNNVRAEVESTNNIMKLRKIAKQNGVEFENNISVSDIKAKIIADLGL